MCHVQDNTPAFWTLYIERFCYKTLHIDTFTQYVWNIAQMMLFNHTCPEEMTAPPNLVPFSWDKAPPRLRITPSVGMVGGASGLLLNLLQHPQSPFGADETWNNLRKVDKLNDSKCY